MPISLSSNSRKIKSNEVKGCNFPCSFWKSTLNFSTYLNSLVAFYFCHHLISAKTLRIEVASSFLPITAIICTVIKHGPGQPQNRRKASSFCLLHTPPQNLGFSFPDWFQDQYSFLSSYAQSFVSQEKATSQAGVEIQGITLFRQEIKSVLLSAIYCREAT